MTLSEMADFICDKVNLTEDEDKASCKKFLWRRFEAIWNDQLWKDSLVDFTQTLSATGYTPASTWLPTKQVLLLPEIFDRVVAVRTGGRRLSVQSQEFYYRSDYDAFSQSGSVVEFFQLKPCVWEFDSSQDLFVSRASVSDSALKPTLDLVLGAVVTRSKPTLTTTPLEIGSYERIDSAAKIASDGAITIKAGGDCVVTNNSAFAWGFQMSPLSTSLADPARVTIQPGGSHTFTPNAFLLVFPTVAAIHPFFSQAAGVDFKGTITFDDVSPWTVNNAGVSVTLAAEDTAAVKRLRLRLVGIPDDGTVLRVLGKAKAPSFSEDSDEPVIQGIENCLLAFGQGDMLERERQYGKAQLCYQEGIALLERLKAIEVVQAAHNKRIVPDDGYGNPYDLWSHPPLSF